MGGITDTRSYNKCTKGQKCKVQTLETPLSDNMIYLFTGCSSKFARHGKLNTNIKNAFAYAETFAEVRWHLGEVGDVSRPPASPDTVVGSALGLLCRVD
jgi:hypothetical protein